MTTDQIDMTTTSERLVPLADMADAAWQSVRSGGFGAPMLQATKALRDMDGKRQELKVYLRACQDSIGRAHAEAVDFDNKSGDEPSNDELLKMARSDIKVWRELLFNGLAIDRESFPYPTVEDMIIRLCAERAFFEQQANLATSASGCGCNRQDFHNEQTCRWVRRDAALAKFVTTYTEQAVRRIAGDPL